MELHNAYTLSCGGRKATALNTVSKNFLRIFAEKTAWARFIVLTEEDGTRTESSAKLQFINADILTGGSLRAVYSAEFEGKSRAVYTAVSIAAERGGEDVSRASLSFTGSSEKVTVTAVIVLDVSYDGDILLTGGDNGLVRRMLGAGASGKFSVATGTSNYPLYPSLRSNLLQSDAETVVPTLTDGKIAFAGQTKAAGSELLLRYNDKAVLRAKRPFTYKTSTMATVVKNGSVYLENRIVDLIGQVTVGGNVVTRYDVMPASTHALAVNENVVAVGVDGYVTSDPGEEYAAIVTHAYVEVYEVDPYEGSVKSILRVPRLNEQVSLCRGGALALWGDNTLTIYQRDGGAYSTYRVAIPGGTSSLVLREGVQYHAVTLLGSTFKRYRVQGENATLLESTAVDPARFVFGRCGESVFYGESRFTVRSITVDSTADYACDAFANKENGKFSAGNYFFIVEQLRGSYVYDFVRNKRYTSVVGYEASGRLLYRENFPLFLYDVANGIRVLAGDFTTKGLTSVAIAGGFLFTVADGVVKSYYLTGNDTAVRVPVSGNDKVCTITVRQKEMQGEFPVAFYIS